MDETRGSVFAAALFGILGFVLGWLAFGFDLFDSGACALIGALIGLCLNILFDKIDEISAGGERGTDRQDKRTSPR